jgi:hypothetical protein
MKKFAQQEASMDRWYRSVKFFLILPLCFSLIGCVEMLARQNYRENLTLNVNKALARQQRILTVMEAEVQSDPSPDAEYLKKAQVRQNEALNLATQRVAAEIERSRDLSAQTIIEYNADAIRFAVLANSLDSKWLEQLRTAKDKCSVQFTNAFTGVTLEQRGYYSAMGNTGGLLTKQVLSEEPEAARFLQESKDNLKRMQETSLKFAASIIKQEEEEDAARVVKVKQEREAAFTAYAEYRQIIAAKGLSGRVSQCQQGPMFAEMRSAMAATALMGQIVPNDKSNLTAEGQERTSGFIETLSRATCECIVAKVSQQPEEMQQRFFAMLKGERQWDVYGTKMGEMIALQFMALQAPCNKQATLVSLPAK